MCPTLTQEQIKTVHLETENFTLIVVWIHVISYIEIGQETQISTYAHK